MPKQPWENLLHLLGFVTWGDLAGLTLHTCKKGRVIVFRKTYPDKPPTEAQLKCRARFAEVSAQWHDLPPAARARWELATRRLSLCLTGYNLWMYMGVRKDMATIRTIERQSGLKLLPPY